MSDRELLIKKIEELFGFDESYVRNKRREQSWFVDRAEVLSIISNHAYGEDEIRSRQRPPSIIINDAVDEFKTNTEILEETLQQEVLTRDFYAALVGNMKLMAKIVFHKPPL